MKGQKGQERFILFTHQRYGPVDRVIDEISSSSTAKYYLTEREMQNAVEKLKLFGLKYEEQEDVCCKAILHRQEEKIYILRAGRTIEEVIDEIFAWLMKHQNKKIHIQMKLIDEHYLDTNLDYEILKMFRIIHRDNGGYIGNFIGKKKHLSVIIQHFLYDCQPVEYCFHSENYHEAWKLIEIESVLIMWKQVGSYGNHIYFEVVE